MRAELVDLVAADLEPAVALAARALADDPLSAHVFRGRDERARLLRLHVAPVLRLALARGFAARTAAWGGLASWLPAGSWPFPEQWLSAAGFDEAAERIGEWALERFLAVYEPVERRHAAVAPAPHRILQLVAVEPARRRRGLGSALVAAGLAGADAAAEHTYLETFNEANLAFYRHHGFEVAASGREQGVRFWCMLREPRDVCRGDRSGNQPPFERPTPTRTGACT